MRSPAIHSAAAPATQEFPEAGPDDQQAQAVLEVTGSGRPLLEREVAELQEAVSVLRPQTAAHRTVYDRFRDGMMVGA